MAKQVLKAAFRSFRVVEYSEDAMQSLDVELCEEPALELRINGKSLWRVLRSPGQDKALAAGLLVSQGLMRPEDEPPEILIGPGIAKVKIPAGSPLTCRMPKPASKDLVFSAGQVARLQHLLYEKQSLRRQTRSAHAAMLCDMAGQVMAVAEDVSRNCAVEKVLGKAFLKKSLACCYIAFASCRLGVDIIRAFALAGLPLVASVSRPTANGVDLARGLNLTLAMATAQGTLIVFSGSQRIRPGF